MNAIPDTVTEMYEHAFKVKDEQIDCLSRQVAMSVAEREFHRQQILDMHREIRRLRCERWIALAWGLIIGAAVVLVVRG